MNDPIYLDHNATTPVEPAVLNEMLPFLRGHFGNPSSTHAFGRRAAQAVAAARARVAALIGAHPDEIVFTGHATEANNLALRGVAALAPATHRRLVISAVEHPAVAAPAEHLRAQGWAVHVVPVDGRGRVSADAVAAAAGTGSGTALVSVMHANNEVGTLQPVAEIGALLRGRGILLHTDAAQAVGKMPVNVHALGVDLLTIAGHKFGAPKGIGALYVRAGTRLAPLLHGAGHEQGLRPGTENVASIVGLGAAAALAQRRLAEAPLQLARLRDRLHALLAAAVPGLAVNGDPAQGLPNTLHVAFPGTTGRAMLAQAGDRVAASLGSACHSGDHTVSGVLAAMAIDPARAAGSLRLSVGWTTTEAEVDAAAEVLVRAWHAAAWESTRPGAAGVCSPSGAMPSSA